MSPLAFLAYTPIEQAYLPVLAMLVVAVGFYMFNLIVSPLLGKSKPK